MTYRILKSLSILLTLTSLGNHPTYAVGWGASLLRPLGAAERRGAAATGAPSMAISKTDATLFVHNSNLMLLLLIKAIRASKGDPVAYKNLAFEIATLLSTESDEIAMGAMVMELAGDIHHYEDYKDAMAIMGLSLVIASHSAPSYIKRFIRPDRNRMNWNDIQRNLNRLAGFFRTEKQALDYVKVFKVEKHDRGQPWYIDSQIAILDALEAIDYKSSRILKKVKRRLQKLSTDNAISGIVKERLGEVISVLEAGGRKSTCERSYEQAKKEFELYAKKVKPEDVRLLSMLNDVKANVPIEDAEYGRFDRDAYELYFSGLGEHGDPVDSCGFEYNKNIDRFRDALTKVRIDYDESLNLVLDVTVRTSAAQPQPLPPPKAALAAI